MVGDAEVIRRIYMVFQDRNWTARPWVISNERIFAGKEKFEITFDAKGTFDAEPFHFEAILSGDNDGTISYEIDGSTDAPFIRNRLGLCVLHPMSAAGSACIIESTTGDTLETAFPIDISPNQPFVDVRAITHEFTPGAWASTRLTGESFEMEDHRNWSDASFKTYCTPISLPFPVTVQPEESIWQSVTVAVDIEDITPGEALQTPTISVSTDANPRPLPRIGLQLPTDEPAWSASTIELLQSMGLAHLRVDVQAADPQAPGQVSEGAARADSIGARLVVAVFAHDPAELARLATAVAHVQVDTWLIFDAEAKVTGPELTAAARSALGPTARIGGGTNLYFTELNRQPPDMSALDVVAFSMNPQVHATDNLSVVQNLAAQAEVARNAARLAGITAIQVGPVTLRPRFNPNATEPDLDHSNTPLPANVDARQLSRLGANWTLGSLKYLAETGAVEAITYFETSGWRGVVERESGSPQPADFPSSPGQPFPVLSALAAVQGFTSVRTVTSNVPTQVDALLLEGPEGVQRLLVVSFSDQPVTVRIEGLPDLPTQLELEPFGLEVVDSRRKQG
jgi:hypothetical protein